MKNSLFIFLFISFSATAQLSVISRTGTQGTAASLNSPTLVTPNIGVATGTSLTMGGAYHKSCCYR